MSFLHHFVVNFGTAEPPDHGGNLSFCELWNPIEPLPITVVLFNRAV